MGLSDDRTHGRSELQNRPKPTYVSAKDDFCVTDVRHTMSPSEGGRGRSLEPTATACAEFHPMVHPALCCPNLSDLLGRSSTDGSQPPSFHNWRYGAKKQVSQIFILLCKASRKMSFNSTEPDLVYSTRVIRVDPERDGWVTRRPRRPHDTFLFGSLINACGISANLVLNFLSPRIPI